jgi:4'-phosphopantetheinyl transferase EntD
MAVKTVYVVQAFETQRKRLVPTTKIDAPSESAAKKRAESIAARTGAAAAIALTLDTESGEVSAAKILARFGAVPDDLDQLTESF